LEKSPKYADGLNLGVISPKDADELKKTVNSLPGNAALLQMAVSEVL
jgi:hypothetical protein